MSDALAPLDLRVLNPATEETVAIVPAATRDDVDAAVARAAYEHTRRTLADRLGTGPGPDLTALHAELLRP
ncbi:BTAD domain-containing putative transcriptional regulator, partial [Streptomyces sp. NPDC002587]